MLEIIILIIVVLLAIIVVGFVSHQRNQKLASDFERELDQDDAANSEFHARYDAVMSHADDVDIGDDLITLDGEKPQTNTEPNNQPEVAGPVIPEPAEATPPEPDWDLVIALTVMAPKDRLFTGRAVKNALDNQDLHFGEMQIYHRFTLGSRKQSLFSAANIVDPGTFLPAELISMKTPGILLFARLPGPVNGLAVLDAMLDCATQIPEQLDGVVCDEQRQPLADEMLQAMRARIFELNLNLQKDARPYDDF